MRHLRELRLRIRGLLRALSRDGGARADAELRDEMEAHLEMAVAEYIRRGMTPDDARRKALLQAGALPVALESVREQRGLPMIESLVRDIRHAFRTLALHRGYSVAVLLTLGLGIAATVTMFSILHAVLLRPLPYANADRIVSLSVLNEDGDMGVVDSRSYEEWRQAARRVGAMAVYARTSAVVQTAAGPQNVGGTVVTESYFSVLGVSPMMGRLFSAEEGVRGGPSVVVLGEPLWRSAFGADPDIVGKSVVLDGSPATVVGVIASRFATPSSYQYWRPYRLPPPNADITYYHTVLARLQPDATPEELRTELAAIQQRVEPTRPESQRGLQPVVMTLHERRFGPVRPTLLLLFAAVGVLLLITCANLANLALARAIRRQREFALRLALGAARTRIVRYVLTESFLLSIGGAILGLLLASLSMGYFVKLSPTSIANAEGIRIDTTVLLFTLGTSVVTTLLFGLLPALTAGRTGINLAVSDSSARSTGSRRQRGMRRALVVFELATALVLVVGAGLVARSFWIVTNIPPGIDAERVLTASVDLPYRQYNDTTAQVLMEALLTRVRGEPTVTSAALADALPLTGARMSVPLDRPGEARWFFEVVGITSQYFETVGTRIIEGRPIAPNAAGEAVISATLAQRLSREGSAVGQQLVVNEQPVTVVGISEDVRQRGLEGSASAVAFVSLSGFGGWRFLELAVRTNANETALQSTITRHLQELDPMLAPPPFRTMTDIVDATVAPRKFVAILLGLFALLAGVLAVVGLYGVLSYLVTEQTREIGIRAALGADEGRVVRFVLGHGAALAGVGIFCGLGIALFAARAMDKLVYDISVYDTTTFVAGTLLLALVSLLASYLPARRASKVDPIVALRVE